MQFSKLSHISPSATVTINGLALKKRAAGERVYNLAAGEPMIGTHVAIIDAAKAAMDREETHYPPVPGIPELRDAVRTWMNTNYSSDFSRNETMVTCGGKAAVNLLMQALVDPGDEVLVITPFWVSYSSIPELYGGVVRIIETTEVNAWKVSPEDIRKHANSKTKCLILNSGSNPTGVLYTKEELKALLEVCKELGIFVVSDEVYSGLVYTGEPYASSASFPEHKDNVAIVHSCSKNFAMTGWRVGFLMAPEEIVKKCTILQGQNTTNTSTISQWAAVGAFEQAEQIIAANRSSMIERRDVFVDTFNALFNAELTKPVAALYSFIPLIAFGVDDIDCVGFCERVLAEANVAMVPGRAFGTGGYVRCSFGETIKELREALEILARYIKD